MAASKTEARGEVLGVPLSFEKLLTNFHLCPRSQNLELEGSPLLQ
jgi:hypothetical protein